MALSTMHIALFLMTTFGCAVICEGANDTVDDNEMGLKVLFDMTNTFLGDVVQTKRISDSFLNLSAIIKNGDINSKEVEDWRSWVEYLMGPTVCIAIGLVFIIAMPIAGMCYCCCRLCGKCGAKKKTLESKNAKCKRRTYCTILLVLNTVMLAGVICAFLSNDLLYKNLKNDNNEGAIGNMISAIQNLDAYVDSSIQEATDFVYDRYGEISSNVLQNVENSADNAVEGVLEAINATAYLNEAKAINKEANETAEALNDVKDDLTALQDNSTQLQNDLDRIRSNIESACSGSCPGFNADDFKTEANFSSLGDLSGEADKVAKALDMGSFIADAEQQINNAKDKARTDVRTQIDDASSSINSINQTVTDGIRELREKKDELLEFVPDAYKRLNDYNEDVSKYSEYVFYGGIGLSCVYLLIVVFYYVGILFGLCGEKPGDGAPCCNTGVGASFLIAGVAFSFIFSWLLMLLCTIPFAVGGPAYTEICRYFDGHDPNDLKVFDTTFRDGFSFFDDFPRNFSVANSIKMCQENKALYSSLHLDSIQDLNSMLNTDTLEEELAKFKTASITTPDVTLMNADLQNRLEEFGNAGLESVNFTRYFEELNKGLTVTDLGTLASAARNYSNIPSLSDASKTTLRESADDLDALDTTVVPAMKQKVNELESTITTLQQKQTIKGRVEELVSGLNKSQTEFNEKKDQLVKAEIDKLADNITSYVSSQITSVKDEIRNDKFRCQRLTSNIYKLTDSVCVMGLDPFNGMWFSFGWCLFFFIPCIVFATLLASQYRREHEYDKEFDDPNYSMYGGPNHDTIPLTRDYSSSGGLEHGTGPLYGGLTGERPILSRNNKVSPI